MKCHQLLNFSTRIFKRSFEQQIEDLKNVDLYKTSKYQIYVYNNQEVLDSNFLNLLTTLDLQLIKSGTLFCTAPNSQGFLHKDILPRVYRTDTEFCKVSLNLQMSSDPGVLEFYDNQAYGYEYYHKIENLWYDTAATSYRYLGKLIDKYASLQPALTRTDIAHRAVNTSENLVRAVYTIRFLYNPDFDTMIKKFRNYLS